MKKGMILGLTLSVLGLVGAGVATTASARPVRGGDLTGVWRLDSHDRGSQWGGHGDGYGRGRWDNGRWSNGPYGDGSRGDRAGFLPEMIRIERNRRVVRVENENGRLLRRIAVDPRGSWDRRLVAERIGFGGARITEVFTLDRRGDRLVVRTTMSGPRGLQEFTSVYERA
jgi:hypothetical protein